MPCHYGHVIRAVDNGYDPAECFPIHDPILRDPVPASNHVRLYVTLIWRKLCNAMAMSRQLVQSASTHLEE